MTGRNAFGAYAPPKRFIGVEGEGVRVLADGPRHVSMTVMDRKAGLSTPEQLMAACWG